MERSVAFVWCIASVRSAVSGATALLGLVLAGCVPAGEANSAVPQVVATSPVSLLIPTPAEIDFGTVPRAGSRSITLLLHNPKSEAVSITGVRTSCDCFKIELDTDVVDAGQTVKVIAKVDFSDEPKYTGQLRLDARGLVSVPDAIAFEIQADVSVCAPSPGNG